MDSNFYVAILVSISSILRIAYHFKLKKESPEDINNLQRFVFYASIALCAVGFVMIARELLAL
jgi:hypothetical protein